MRADFFSAATGAHLWARKVYKGVLITGMKYTPAEAAEAVETKEADAICFGTLAIANPDLVERAARGAALNAPDPATFYSRGAEGYTTYPTLS
eukprot:gene12293-biopygen8598